MYTSMSGRRADISLLRIWGVLLLPEKQGSEFGLGLELMEQLEFESQWES